MKNLRKLELNRKNQMWLSFAIKPTYPIITMHGNYNVVFFTLKYSSLKIILILYQHFKLKEQCYRLFAQNFYKWRKITT